MSSFKPLATQHIREFNHKWPCLQDKDPHSVDMNSGRHAVLNVQSMAQNAEAQECATLGMGPVPSQTCQCSHKCASTPAPSPTPPSHLGPIMCGTHNPLYSTQLPPHLVTLLRVPQTLSPSPLPRPTCGTSHLPLLLIPLEGTLHTGLMVNSIPLINYSSYNVFSAFE